MANKPEGLVFDLDGVTGRDMQAFEAGGGLAAQIKLFCKVVKQMPEGWGDPSKEETYRKQPFRRTVQIREWFTKELSAVKSEVIGLAFDVEAITTEEMEQIGKNIPAVMAKYTKRTPKTWGTPVTEDTFLDLRYPVYVAAMALFKEAIEDLGKN